MKFLKSTIVFGVIATAYTIAFFVIAWALAAYTDLDGWPIIIVSFDALLFFAVSKYLFRLYRKTF